MCFALILSVTTILGLHPSIAAEKTDRPFKKIRFGVGYIPNVQFAPIYVAQEKGFYAEEGLEVGLEYGFENDFVLLTAQGEREFALASGDQVILARAQGIPITYIMKWHQRYPVALMVPSSKNITRLSQLKGKRVGIPGFFGASFIGWKALLFTSGLHEKDVQVKQIGFTQASAVQQDLVDAAVVYIVNEPIQLRNAGVDVHVFEVSDYIDLVSNGLVVGEKLMKDDPDLVKGTVRATQRGMQYAIANPDEAFEISRKMIPEISDEDAPVQRQVMDASIELWKSDEPGISSKKAWQDSIDFMRKTGILDKPVDINTLFTNRFIQTR